MLKNLRQTEKQSRITPADTENQEWVQFVNKNGCILTAVSEEAQKQHKTQAAEPVENTDEMRHVTDTG